MARQKKYGWVPDLPDHRDHRLKVTAPIILPPQVNLIPLCPPVYDQGQAGSCTGNAIAGAMEFDMIRQLRPSGTSAAMVAVIVSTMNSVRKPVFTPSRLFIYYNERVMENSANSDSGGQLRDGIKSVASLGVCPESEWPYDIDRLMVKPPDSCYTDALKFEALQYESVTQSLYELKACLAAGFPFVFGFSVFNSFESNAVARSGHAPLPGDDESMLGGHAAMCVGYDDTNQWFIVRNSWGTNWGMKGYFTLPYGYLTNPDLSSDFWVIKTVSA